LIPDRRGRNRLIDDDELGPLKLGVIDYIEAVRLDFLLVT